MNQQQLDELVADLGKQRERECDNLAAWFNSESTHVQAQRDSEFEQCFDCNGMGKVTDPQAQAAWEVLTYECYCSTQHYLYDRAAHAARGVKDCNGTGRIPHDMTQHGDGAWIGMLSEAVMQMGWDTLQPHIFDDEYEAHIYDDLEDGLGKIIATGLGATPPEALMAAFKQTLETRLENHDPT